MQIPEITFTKWYPWDEIKNIPDKNKTGIYIIARFESTPLETANPASREVMYIGETHGRAQSLYKRLNKFFKAAQTGGGKYKHSGGNRFNKIEGNNLSNIYAAVYAPQFENEHFRNPFIFYAERKLIWEYMAKWDEIPVCNGY